MEKVLAMLKGGGHKKFWGSFYAVSFSHNEEGVQTNVHSLKRGT